MEIKTYSQIWNARKALYSIGDISVGRLPYISLGVGALVALIWIPLMTNAFSLNFTDMTHILILIGVPFAAGWGADQIKVEEKSVTQLISSRIGYLLEPKVLTDMHPPTENLDNEVAMLGTVWVTSNNIEDEG